MPVNFIVITRASTHLDASRDSHTNTHTYTTMDNHMGIRTATHVGTYHHQIFSNQIFA